MLCTEVRGAVEHTGAKLVLRGSPAAETAWRWSALAVVILASAGWGFATMVHVPEWQGLLPAALVVVVIPFLPVLRRKVVLDGDRRLVVAPEAELPLDAVVGVNYFERVLPGAGPGSPQGHCYTVDLRLASDDGGSVPVEVFRTLSQFDAWSGAREAARFLGVPLFDGTTTEELKPAELDLPLGDRLRLRGETVEPGPPPRGVRVDDEPPRWTVDVSRPWGLVGESLALGGILAFVPASFVPAYGTPAVIATAVVFVIAATVTALVSLPSSHFRVVLDGGLLRIRAPFGRSHELALADLQAVQLAELDRLVLVTSDRAVRKAVSPGVARWLVRAVTRQVRDRSAPGSAGTYR